MNKNCIKILVPYSLFYSQEPREGVDVGCRERKKFVSEISCHILFFYSQEPREGADISAREKKL
jgi:hypothetical protein